MDSEDKSETKEVHSLQKLMKLEDKALARRDATTHTQQTEKMASLCKGKNEVKGNGRLLILFI